jgi:hypothetical protein
MTAKKLDDKRVVNLLTRIALRVFFDAGDLSGKRKVAGLVQRAVGAAWARADDAEKKKFLAALERMEARKSPRAPPFIVRWLGNELSTPGLIRWAKAEYPKLFDKLGADAMARLISEWLAKQKLPFLAGLHKAGVRYGVGVVKAADEALISQSLGQVLSDKEEAMATEFKIDLRGTPSNFNASDFTAAVNAALEQKFSAKDQTTQVSVSGLLLLGEHFEPKSSDFGGAVTQAWLELLETTKDITGKDVLNKDIFKFVMDNAAALTGRTGASPTVFHQEVASAARHAIQNAGGVPFGHPNFPTQVRIGLDNYVSGTPLADSLDLPPLTGEFGEDEEIEPDNIRAVALVYAANQLEDMRLFGVVDRITELFYNGLLPIGFDAGGKAIDTYYWDREDRMKESERRMIYSRVLGVPGGDVSKEAVTNTQFDSLFTRFLASLAEYDRQQRISDLIERRRPANLTSEYVRKAGRDLAANASLHGWGGTHFAARRLNNHIAKALDILKQPSIQKAYGVTGPFPLIERVCATEFGFTPNVVKNRTMADAGKKILDLVAQYSKAWSNGSGRQLFEEPIDGKDTPSFDIPIGDRNTLILQTQYWLAVNGIKDDQVDKLSEPELSAYTPSIPSIGRVGANVGAGTNGGGGDQMDRIKQMVSQGQVPTLDQLQQIIGGSKIGA